MPRRNFIFGIAALLAAAAAAWYFVSTPKKPQPCASVATASSTHTTELDCQATHSMELSASEVAPWVTLLNDPFMRFGYPGTWTSKQYQNESTYFLRSPSYKPVMRYGQLLEEVMINAVPNPRKLPARSFFSMYDDNTRLWFDSLPYKEMKIGQRSAYVFPDTDFSEKDSTQNTTYVISCPSSIVTLTFRHETDHDADTVRKIAESVGCK